MVISVADLRAGLAFYRELLGLSVTRDAPGFTWLQSIDGVEVMLHERPATPSDAAVSIGFTVDDLHAVIDAWHRRGGAVLKPPAEQAWGELMAVVRDADGHIVCLSQRNRNAVRPW